MNSSTSTTEDAPVVDLAEVALHDYRFAREASGFSEFAEVFVGALADTTSQTPEGRKAWATALKAVTR